MDFLKDRQINCGIRGGLRDAKGKESRMYFVDDSIGLILRRQVPLLDQGPDLASRQSSNLKEIKLFDADDRPEPLRIDKGHLHSNNQSRLRILCMQGL